MTPAWINPWRKAWKQLAAGEFESMDYWPAELPIKKPKRRKAIMTENNKTEKQPTTTPPPPPPPARNVKGLQEKPCWCGATIYQKSPIGWHLVEWCDECKKLTKEERTEIKNANQGVSCPISELNSTSVVEAPEGGAKNVKKGAKNDSEVSEFTRKVLDAVPLTKMREAARQSAKVLPPCGTQGCGSYYDGFGSVCVSNCVDFSRVFQGNLRDCKLYTPMPAEAEDVKPPAEFLDVLKPSPSDKAKNLASAHWEYVSGILATHGISVEQIDMIGFHYKTAMVHGYKHGLADAEANI